MPKKGSAGAKRAVGQQQLTLGAQKKRKAEADAKKEGVQQRIDDIAKQKKAKEQQKEENQKPLQSVKKEAEVSKKPLAPGLARRTKSGKSVTVQEAEDSLRLFDLDSRYGPCMSSTRLERWERAHRLKLDPPKDVKELLEAFPEMVDKSVWHGRVHESMKCGSSLTSARTADDPVRSMHLTPSMYIDIDDREAIGVQLGKRDAENLEDNRLREKKKMYVTNEFGGHHFSSKSSRTHS